MKKLIVALDPGHGGSHRGGGSRGEIDEADYCLDQALRVRNMYDRRGDTLVYLTRDSDRAVSHAERTKLSKDMLAQLVISIHVNAEAGGTMHGFRSFYWPGNMDTKAVGAAVNAGMPMPLQSAYAPMPVRRDWRQQSEGWLHHPGKIVSGHQADTVLLELGFITSRPDYDMLSSLLGRQTIALAISSGIEKYRGLV